MNWAYIWCGMFVLMLAWHIVERRVRKQVFDKAINDFTVKVNARTEAFIEEMTALHETRLTEFVDSVKDRLSPSVRDAYMAKIKGQG